ncbi:hypothetical protein QWA_18327, partial [Alcaligenes faecalis subsp. faecalis NCIB 8687]
GGRSPLHPAHAHLAGKDLPNLVQLGEMSGLDEVADRPYILPMQSKAMASISLTAQASPISTPAAGQPSPAWDTVTLS